MIYFRNLVLITFVACCIVYKYLILLLNYYDLFICNILTNVQELQTTYDYVVVGAGSAGSVVAHRLGQDLNLQILILEAGPYIGSIIDIPGITPLLHNSKISWQYETVPQKHACYGLQNNKSKWPAGKVAGGSSRINNMIYARGHRNDFESWYENEEGFNYDQDILYYFKKAEYQQGSYINDSKYHSSGRGPLYVTDSIYTTIAENIIEAIKYLGYDVTDLNGDKSIGFMIPQVNINKGRRSSTFHYLYNNKNSNIKIQTHSQVVKVLFRSKFEAYAVIYRHLGKYFKVKARKGIILSAGVIGTPKILMLSGIGDRKHLNSINIDCINELPVGNNLQDHVTTGIDLIVLNSNVNLRIESLLSPKAGFDYYFNSIGSWTTNGCEILGILNINGEYPDLGFMVIPTGLTADNGWILRNNLGINDKTWQGYFTNIIGNSSISILPFVLHPKSKGFVRLPDKNPFSQPLIDPNYLSDESDVNLLVEGIKIIEKILNTESMHSIGAFLNPNKISGCEHLEFKTKDYWKCYVRHLTISAYHPVGTCKMGKISDKTAVVNYDFQVINTNKLYVVDASIFPTLISANINAAVIMMAEKASDVIKHHQYLLNDKCHKIEVFKMRQFCKKNVKFNQ